MPEKNRFIPQHPSKYLGNPTNIIYRSSWEKRVMIYLDTQPAVIGWASEEIVIPYVSPVDGRYHRYFPDFYVKVLDKTGCVKEMIWEIKPKKETFPPQKKSRITQKYIREVVTWGVNEAKWKAAKEYCLDRKWDFKVLTENDIGIK